MSADIDVFWSFRSPYSYLIAPDLVKLELDFDVKVVLKPVLPIALRSKETLFNSQDRSKIEYILLDSRRRADMLGLPMQWPNPDPVVQNIETFEVSQQQPHIYKLSWLGIDAQRQGKGAQLAKAVSHLIFSGVEGWNEDSKLSEVLQQIDLDYLEMISRFNEAETAQILEANQRALEASGHWGVPTAVVSGEPFFGQDRIDTLRWRLRKLGLER